MNTAGIPVKYATLPQMSDATTPLTFGAYAGPQLRTDKKNGMNLNGSKLDARLDALLTAYTAPKRAKKAPMVIPPKASEVTEYFLKIEYPISGEEFCDSYEQKGWMIGKNKMKNWQSACRNWKTNKWGNVKHTFETATAASKDYSQF